MIGTIIVLAVAVWIWVGALAARRECKRMERPGA